MDDPAQPPDELKKIEAAIQSQEALRGILPDEQIDKVVKALQDQKQALLSARQEVDIRTKDIKGKEVNLAGHDVTKIVVEKGAKLVLGGDVTLDEEPVRSNLPHQASFFGRQKELQIIENELSPESRTWGVLVDGPGGIVGAIHGLFLVRIYENSV